MNNKNKNLLNNIGILTISNFSSKILVFLLVPLYTRVLSTSEYGIYDLVITTISLLFPIITCNIIDAVMRFMMDNHYKKNDVVTIGIRYISFGILIFLIFLIFIKKLNYIIISDLYMYIFLYYVFYSLYQYMIQVSKGLEEVKYMGIAGVLGTVSMIIFNLLFLLVFNLKINGFFLANILSQTIPSVYLFIKIKLWKYIDLKSWNKKLNHEMLDYCVPLIITVVGWWINSGSDRYIVTLFCGIAANGLLSIAYKIPTILNTFQGIFIQAWQISAIKEYGSQDTKKFYGDIFITVNLLMCIICSWLIILTRPIASLIYSNGFYIAWKYVPFLLLSSVFNSASGLLGAILSAKKNSRAMMWSAIIGCVANIFLNILLVSLIGIQGAVISTAICSYMIYYVRMKAVGDDIKIVNYNIIISTWIFLCIQGIIEILNFSYVIEIIIMGILLMINSRQVIALMNLSLIYIKKAIKRYEK